MVLDFNFNRAYSEELKKLIKFYCENIETNKLSNTQRALNFFLVNILNSYDTLLLLIDRNKLIDTHVIARRIIEIVIKNEYLSFTERYEDFYRERYHEKQQILRTLIKGHRAKDIIENPIWKERHIILAENKKLYSDLKLKRESELPNIEQMAKKVNLSYLYSMSYSSWSKLVHCNMSAEFSVLSSNSEDFNYDVSETKIDSVRMGIYRGILSSVNASIVIFLEKYIEITDLYKDTFIKFKQKNILASVDLFTGRSSKSDNIAKKMAENLYGITLDLPMDESETILETDMEKFKRNNEELEDLILKTESEISRLREL